MLIAYTIDHDPRGHVVKATTSTLREIARYNRWTVRRAVSALRAGEAVRHSFFRFTWEV